MTIDGRRSAFRVPGHIEVALKRCDDRQCAADPGIDRGRLTGDFGGDPSDPLHEWVVDRGSGRLCRTENGHLEIVKAVALEVGLETREDLIGRRLPDTRRLELDVDIGGVAAESAVRAYKIAMTPPMMPVLLVLDGGLQEDPISEEVKPRLRIPKLTLTSPPQGDAGAVAETARLLVAAQNPVIIADRLARTPAGMAHLVELAELLQAPVIDQGGRMNFPTQHPLNMSNGGRALIGNADVILGLELTDFWGTVDSFRDSLVRTSRPLTKPGTKLISVTAGDLFMKSNYQDFQRYPEVDIAMAADAEATLPPLIEAVKRALTSDRKTVFDARGKRFAEQHANGLDRSRSDAAYAWDASPISTARLTAELWNVIKNEDWTLVSASGNTSNWEKRLWKFDKHYQWIGGSGGAGVGYGAPAAVGGALANKKHGRISVTIQGDGDFMYAPGVWWTAAHHKLPLLAVMHNNRAYHQEVMHVQRMGNRHNRGVTRAHIGTTLEDPFINFAQIVKGMGVYSEGPISNPNDLGPAMKRALDVVKKGEPALVDVVTQPR
jgi:thiamine pyrophosphate-dependent acetolactate synthase large subunit-like protein